MLVPSTEQDVAEAIAAAKSPLSIRGAGTRGALTDGEPLTTANLSGITLYEPGALTIVAKAGTPVSDIEKALSAEKQMLAFEPMSSCALLGTTGGPTIGGVVATNASGPRRVQAGACRDFLLGVRFVDGIGNIVKNGGRVMKNVTGYDLARMMCGARGTLGVLTEVSLKVLPKPEFAATLVFEGIAPDASIQLMSDAMQSPFEVSGAAWVPAGVAGEEAACLIRLEGFEASVKYRLQELTKNLGNGRVATDPSETARLWETVRDVTPFADREGDVWCLSIKPTDFGFVPEATAQNTLIDWAGGRVWIVVPTGLDLRARMHGLGGHATRVRGKCDAIPRFHPEVEALAKIAIELRRKYDPKGILNPGLMG